MVPPEYVALESTPPGIVAEYPLGLDPDQLFWQRTYDRRFRVCRGTPDRRTTPDEHLSTLLKGTAEALALLGVTAVVVHPDAPRPSTARARGGFRLDSGYRLVTKTSDGRRYGASPRRPLRRS
jgi:hypothetical protein